MAIVAAKDFTELFCKTQFYFKRKRKTLTHSSELVARGIIIMIVWHVIMNIINVESYENGEIDEIIKK